MGEQRKGTKETLKLKIYNDLISKFMTNELAPGEIINRQALADEFQVSMAPVRDALQMLAQDGFIEIRSRSITIVRAIQKEDILGNLIMREAIESQAARIICGRIVEKNLDILLEEARLLDEEHDQIKYWQADVLFHRHLVELTDCQLMIHTYRQVMNICNFYQINSYFMNDNPKNRLDHSELVKKLITPNQNVAEDAIRRHLQSGKMNS